MAKPTAADPLAMRGPPTLAALRLAGRLAMLARAHCRLADAIDHLALALQRRTALREPFPPIPEIHHGTDPR